MEQTTNYQLSQWDGEDRILREDFNADNAKVDAALKAEAEAQAAADTAEATARAALAAQVAKLGNCKVWTSSYVGTGKYGDECAPRKLTFPAQPQAVSIVRSDGYPFTALVRGMPYGRPLGYSIGTTVDATWNGNAFSWHSYHDVHSAMNVENVTYYVLALLAADK